VIARLLRLGLGVRDAANQIGRRFLRAGRHIGKPRCRRC
jgi:hypothetical protein